MKLILGCSATKAAIAPDQDVEFFDLYAGPMWLQVKAAAFDRDRVAALSAQYGFLEPRREIRTYNARMDERVCRGHPIGRNRTRADLFITYGNDLSRLAAWIAGERCVVFAGAEYRRIVEAASARFPEPCALVELAGGSFLEQRKRLGQELRRHAAL